MFDNENDKKLTLSEHLTRLSQHLAFMASSTTMSKEQIERYHRLKLLLEEKLNYKDQELLQEALRLKEALAKDGLLTVRKEH